VVELSIELKEIALPKKYKSTKRPTELERKNQFNEMKFKIIII